MDMNFSTFFTFREGLTFFQTLQKRGEFFSTFKIQLFTYYKIWVLVYVNMLDLGMCFVVTRGVEVFSLCEWGELFLCLLLNYTNIL